MIDENLINRVAINQISDEIDDLFESRETGANEFRHTIGAISGIVQYAFRLRESIENEE